MFLIYQLRILFFQLQRLTIGEKDFRIMDRDPLFTACLRQTLMDSRTKRVRLPPRSPDLNAFAERFVLPIKSECLNKIIPLGEKHLRSVIKEYMEHYHRERNHQERASTIHANENVGRGKGIVKNKAWPESLRIAIVVTLQ